MSTVNKLINNRHTTRLMTKNISQQDVETILDSARRAPSKNKIYGYKVFALGESEYGQELKKELCEKVTLYMEGNTPIYLLQTQAPLVLVYMTNPAPEHQMVGVDEQSGEQVFDRVYSEVTNPQVKDAMVKSSIRDAMISATYAQLTAEDLGYGTAFVACGLEDIKFNAKFSHLWKENFGEDYLKHPIEPVVIVCIGPKDEKIVDIYSKESTTVAEPYLNGETHFRRSGREESFLVNIKQENMIKKI